MKTLLICCAATLASCSLFAETTPAVPLETGNVYVYDAKLVLVRIDREGYKPGRIWRHWTQIFVVDTLDTTDNRPFYLVREFDPEKSGQKLHHWFSDEHSFFQKATACCSPTSGSANFETPPIRMMWVDSVAHEDSHPTWCYGLYDEDENRYDGVEIRLNDEECFNGKCKAQLWLYTTQWATFGECLDRSYLTTNYFGMLKYWEAELKPYSVNQYQYVLRGAVIGGRVYGDTSQATPPATSVPDNFTDEWAQVNFSLFPNPTTGDLTLDFTLETQGLVTAELFDMRGALVKHVFQREYAAGSHRTTSRMDFVKAGVFVLRVRIGEKVMHRLVTLVK